MNDELNRKKNSAAAHVFPASAEMQGNGEEACFHMVTPCFAARIHK